MFSKFFINRPIFATVLALLIVVAGLVTLNILPVAQFPEITPPTVQVSAVYPGANAETVAQTVGIPIEQQVNGVDGMLYMSSNSSSSGAYSLTITFAVGTDIDMATVQVQNRVSIAQSSLPEPVVVQGVTVQKQSSNIVMFLTMTSQDSVYNSLYLTNYAKLNLVDQLTRVPGVGAVNVMGAGDYSMRIWLDPEAMRIRNISPQQVYQSIQSQNVEVSAGYIGQPIGQDNNNSFQYTLNVQGRLKSPEQFGDIIIRREQNGAMLRLKDIARIDLGSASYSVVSRLNGKPTAAAVVNRFNGEAYMTIQAAEVFAMVPPAIPGLGASGGLQLQLEDRRNLGPTEMQQAINALLASYHSKPALGSVSSQYQANVPQYFLNIDRDKVQFMGIALNDVFSTLGYYMGAAYVNDFVEFGRIYQVKIEARDQAQRVIDDVLKLSVPNAAGEMVPFSSFTKVEEQLGQDQINRYNMYSTASLTCNVAPGSSTGQAIQEVEALFKEQLGDEFGYEWTSVAYQETQAGNTTTIVLVMALIVAFLVLAAQYESWTSPVAAVIGLPVALLGAMIGCLIMGTPVSIYTQIGIILLVALSAKNGILIVEFARDFRAEGNSIREAAFEAGHVRLRPILMTSFAFVLGVMPLLFATGAGAQSRIALGAAVVFGMAMNTLLATIYIPNFYELMQKLQERFSKKKADDGSGKDAATQ